MIVRVTFGNIAPSRAAQRLQGAGISGTVYACTGAGDWGIEEGCTVEAAFKRGAEARAFRAWIVKTLATWEEQAAYVTVAGKRGTRALLLWQDGRVERIG